MSEHATSTDVLVIGGGMAGLAGALALRENGANVTLVERAPEFGEVGAGLQMAPNASRVLQRWGLLEKALQIGVQPKHLVFRDAVTGEELTRQTLNGEFTDRYGAPYVVIHRSDLHRVLLEGCEAAGVTLINDVMVESVETVNGRGVAHTAAGVDYEADVVIGADGLKSTLRPLVTNDEPVPSAYVAYRGGDRSVREKGYLTLDIRRYTDIGLSFVLPVIFLLLGGIPLPGGAVWIDHGAIRSRAVRSLVSLAGPGTNLVIGALLTVAVAGIPMPDGLAVGLSCLALIQVLAFVLNILPVPGLDGFGVLEPFLSTPARRLAARVRPWAPIVLLLLLIGVPGVSTVFFGLAYTVFDAVGGNGRAAQLGYGELLFWR